MKKPHWLTVVGLLAGGVSAGILSGGIALPLWLGGVLGVISGTALKMSPGKKQKDITGFPKE